MDAELTVRDSLTHANGGNRSTPLVGEYALSVIHKHYQQMTDCEQGVIEDLDPEYLHQMRVNSRRLGAALRIFDKVVKLPKAARESRVRQLTKTLGELRDLDVQIDRLEGEYYPCIHQKEQKRLSKLLDTFAKRRRQALAGVRLFLSHSRYKKFKQGFSKWFDRPKFELIATLPVSLILPELLSPLLADLLIHPGWLVSATPQSKEDLVHLHNLRKTCKYIRYQTELFTDFYPKHYSTWIKELKYLQDKLGTVQDLRVLTATLTAIGPKPAKLPELKQLMQDRQIDELFDWEDIRHKYLDLEFRKSLHLTIVSPSYSTNQSSVAVISGE
ncbi:MAG: CHAD domain-containing protein [Synechococcus sp.]